MTHHSGDALRTHCSYTNVRRTGFHKFTCDRRVLRARNLIYMSVSLMPSSAQVVLSVANVAKANIQGM